MTQTQKEEADSQLWRELEGLASEHRDSIEKMTSEHHDIVEKLRYEMDAQRLEAVSMVWRIYYFLARLFKE